MGDTDQSGAVPALTLRTRAVFNLPVEYAWVYIEIRIGHIKKAWKTHRVPVINGSALIDFWIRIPGKGNEAIQLKVRASSYIVMPVAIEMTWG